MIFVYNRTKQNVIDAKTIRTKKFLKNEDLTEQEKAIVSKGSFSLDDINRIENNIYQIQTNLEENGYYSQMEKELVVYEQQDVFRKNNLTNWIQKTDALKKSFFVYDDTPKKPLAIYHYEEINKLEKILFDINNRLSEMKSLFRECGNYECGG